MIKRAVYWISCAAVAATLATPLHAASLPQGWEQRTEGALTVYTVPQTPALEFRLHAPEARSNDLANWFARRIQTPPDGINMKSAGNATRTDPNAFSAVYTGTRQTTGSNVLILGMGCETKGGAFRFAELLLPPDKKAFEVYAADASTLMGRACIATTPAVTANATTKPSAVAATVNSAHTTSSPARSGAGLRSNQIEAILFSWRYEYRYTGLSMVENAFLLLKDGSYRRDVPQVPLDDFDIAADKAADQSKWGKWQKRNGSYLLDNSTPSHQSVKVPAHNGETLNGHYRTGSGGRMGSTSYWQFDDVWLNADGRFSTSISGGMAGSTAPSTDINSNAGIDVNSIGTYDDEGSTASTSSGIFGGGSVKRNGSTKSDRSGTYKLNGYTMELHYDNGRVVRQLFFTNDNRQFVWFGGRELLKAEAE
jgi:hypothetical protein